MPDHHRIDYVEFHAPDLDAIKAFYNTVFGWEFTDYGPGYTAFKDGRLDGGFELGDVPPNHPNIPLVILFSDDLDASEAAVTGAGGTITVAQFDFPGGRRFGFADPAGNHLAVWAE
jgi:hypothetical protein